MNEKVIILTDGKNYEVWGGLAEICRVYGFSRDYLKTKKYPFTYKGIQFIRKEYRTKLDVKTDTDFGNLP